jgi:hypothetical protein
LYNRRPELNSGMVLLFASLYSSPGKNLQGFIHNLIGDALLRQ